MNYWLTLIIALVIFVFGMAAWNYSAAEMEMARARADAIRIEARAEARATTLYALLPWGVILAFGLPATILALRWQPRREIRHEVTFQIEADKPRREVWQAMSTTGADLLDLPEVGKDDTKTIIVVR